MVPVRWCDGYRVYLMVITQISQKVALAWCMSEDLQCKENDRKLKIGDHGRVSGEKTHQWFGSEKGWHNFSEKKC